MGWWTRLIEIWMFLFICLYAIYIIMSWIDLSRNYSAVVKELEEMNKDLKELKMSIIGNDDGK